MNAHRGLILAALLSGALLALPAAAQKSSGGIMGKAAAGTVVTVPNEGSGLQRETTVKSNGRYELRNLPTGTYAVTLKRPDGSSDTVLVAVRGGIATRVP